MAGVLLNSLWLFESPSWDWIFTLDLFLRALYCEYSKNFGHRGSSTMPCQGESVHQQQAGGQDVRSLGQFADDSYESPVLVLQPLVVGLELRQDLRAEGRVGVDTFAESVRNMSDDSWAKDEAGGSQNANTDSGYVGKTTKRSCLSLQF